LFKQFNETRYARVHPISFCTRMNDDKSDNLEIMRTIDMVLGIW